MNPAWDRELCRLVASARNAGEIALLFDDLLTPAEREAITERWQIARLLIQGKTQREIRDELSTSIATVNRGAHALKNSRGGFKRHYARLFDRSPR